MSSEYDHIITGSLKLKSKSSLSKRPSPTPATVASIAKSKEYMTKSLPLNSSSSMAGPSSHKSDVAIIGPTKTSSELAFEEIQRQRIREKAKKMALKSHKEKVADFNKHLESLSEHYDVPKVGPG